MVLTNQRESSIRTW